MDSIIKTVCVCIILWTSCFSSQAQSVTVYLCNDCTYRSAKDSETITFLTDGQVKINGKLAPKFSCFNDDGLIVLRYKGKVVNHLNWFSAQEKGYQLLDDRGIGYYLVKCTGDMPSMQELNNPDYRKGLKRN